eukprot:CAMPEP_0185744558 /NCGR_PEP_ID=MMETSP1174-20130828/2731_1 /TAXON_ID=35687 /ORGANISM="Dictyocha speculum, Strain CCMP1381" /LENGTH=31 /DNA_ID= /DNA_START= /DNA_END= /DNA_ORIENTATION=
MVADSDVHDTIYTISFKSHSAPRSTSKQCIM